MVNFLFALLASPAVQSLIVMGVTALAAKIGFSWLSANRAGIITKVAIKVIDELTTNATKENYTKVLVDAMTQLYNELTADPALKVTRREIEALKPFVIAYTQRKLGIIEKPMAP